MDSYGSPKGLVTKTNQHQDWQGLHLAPSYVLRHIAQCGANYNLGHGHASVCAHN